MPPEPPATGGALWRIPKAVRLLGGLAFTMAAVWFMWAAYRSGQERIGDFSMPSIPAMFVSGLAVAIALCAWTWIWGRLLGVRLSMMDVRGFLLGLVGKYIPGGIWTPGAHVVVGTRKGSAQSAVLAVLRQAGIGILGAVAWIVPLSLVIDWPPALRFAAVAGVVLAWVVWLRFDIAGGVVRLRRGTGSATGNPLSWRLGLALLFAAALTFFMHGVGFGVLLGRPGIVVAAAGYAVAWAVGYVALPFPAGLGVREAALIALLGHRYPSSLLVATSVVFRLVTLATEGLLLGGVAIASRWSGERRSSTL